MYENYSVSDYIKYLWEIWFEYKIEKSQRAKTNDRTEQNTNIRKWKMIIICRILFLLLVKMRTWKIYENFGEILMDQEDLYTVKWLIISSNNFWVLDFTKEFFRTFFVRKRHKDKLSHFITNLSIPLQLHKQIMLQRVFGPPRAVIMPLKKSKNNEICQKLKTKLRQQCLPENNFKYTPNLKCQPN